jgi:hypothetical protein
MVSTKDWMRDVPTTDAEAEEALALRLPMHRRQALLGLYRLKRLRGWGVVEAYREVLRAVVVPEERT